MKPQNFGNHRQIVYGYYLTTGVPILVLIGIAVGKIFSPEERSFGFILLLIGWILLTLLFRSRGFALKAQDRAIRAEEGLRHLVLTGKKLDDRLTLSQLIALRFAADEEFAALAKKAAEENLSNKQIKQAIKQWRSDWHRV